MVDPFPNELQELREKYLYNISPWSQSVQNATKRGIRLFYNDSDDQDDTEDVDKIALATAYGLFKRRESIGREIAAAGSTLDIGLLKQQYVKLMERQRQAHVIISAACTNSMQASTASVNHLLIGKNALLNKGRRIGPPAGSIPSPTRTVNRESNGMRSGKIQRAGVGTTNNRRTDHDRLTNCNSTIARQDQNGTVTEQSVAEAFSRKDQRKTRSSSSSSSSTELCDDEVNKSSDFDQELNEPAYHYSDADGIPVRDIDSQIIFSASVKGVETLTEIISNEDIVREKAQEIIDEIEERLQHCERLRCLQNGDDGLQSDKPDSALNPLPPIVLPCISNELPKLDEESLVAVVYTPSPNTDFPITSDSICTRVNSLEQKKTDLTLSLNNITICDESENILSEKENTIADRDSVNFEQLPATPSDVINPLNCSPSEVKIDTDLTSSNSANLSCTLRLVTPRTPLSTTQNKTKATSPLYIPKYRSNYMPGLQKQKAEKEFDPVRNQLEASKSEWEAKMREIVELDLVTRQKINAMKNSSPSFSKIVDDDKTTWEEKFGRRERRGRSISPNLHRHETVSTERKKLKASNLSFDEITQRTEKLLRQSSIDQSSEYRRPKDSTLKFKRLIEESYGTEELIFPRRKYFYHSSPTSPEIPSKSKYSDYLTPKRCSERRKIIDEDDTLTVTWEENKTWKFELNSVRRFKSPSPETIRSRKFTQTDDLDYSPTRFTSLRNSPYKKEEFEISRKKLPMSPSENFTSSRHRYTFSPEKTDCYIQTSPRKRANQRSFENLASSYRPKKCSSEGTSPTKRYPTSPSYNPFSIPIPVSGFSLGKTSSPSSRRFVISPDRDSRSVFDPFPPRSPKRPKDFIVKLGLYRTSSVDEKNS